MAMMGDLADASLADLLFLLSTRRRTGHLVVQARGDEAQLHLTDGRVMLVTSSNSSLRLGRTLLRLGFITHERLREALQEQENVTMRRSLGSILTARGWLSPDELGYCVEDHAIAVVAWIVGWERGSFIFTRTEDSRPHYPLDLPADLLLIEATRRWDEIERLRAFLPPPGHRLIPGPHLRLFAETLGPAEAALVKVVERTDGAVASVIDGLMMIDELAAWRTIISLRERGVLASAPALS